MNHSKDLLRFATIGNVDDGKSTLIGRLLFDSKAVYQDQLEYVRKTSEKMGSSLNLSLLTDGLKAEKEQGITIDVAHRYMETNKRKFIIHDCPGHTQYTKNMITGISNVNLVITLLDARYGIREQTRRHCLLSSMMGIKHLVLAVNKMDLVNYSEKIFEEIKETFSDFLAKLEIPDVQFFPISALNGDNIVNKSSHMSWYQGNTLSYHLENVHIRSDNNLIDPRFPIQPIFRVDSESTPNYRASIGQVESGIFKQGDEILILPTHQKTRIKKIQSLNGECEQAFFPMNVHLILEDPIDASRGDMIAKPDNLPLELEEIEMMICWLDEKPLNSKLKYLVKHTTNETYAIIEKIYYKINISNLHKEETLEIKTNEIARIRIKTSQKLYVDSFRKNRATGSLILIDPFSSQTVGAGLILG